MTIRISNGSYFQSRQSGFYFAIIAIGIGLLVPISLNIVLASGVTLKSRMVHGSLLDDYIIGLVWAIVLGLSILIWPVPARDKRLLLWAWLVKSVVTLGLMLFYEWHYTSLDAYSYFSHLRVLRSETSIMGLDEMIIGSGGTRNFLKIIWFLSDIYILPDSYHGIKVSLAMIGLVGIYLFYRAAVAFFREDDSRIFYLLALFPSILFWSSIFGKEPIVFLGIALYFYGVVKWKRVGQLRYLLILVLGIIIAALIRIWLGPMMILPLIFLFLCSIRDPMLKIIFLALTALGFRFVLNKYIDISLFTTEYLMELANSLPKNWALGGSANLSTGFSSPFSMIKFVPLGVFTALFRPLPGEVLNPFGLLAGLENIFMLGFVWLAIKRASWKTLKEPLVIWILIFIVTWAIPYAFISYHNMGTAVRYKLMILPVMLILLLYLSRRKDTLSPER